MPDSCFACRNAANVDTGPITEAVYVGRGWRVAHALNTSLRGWLVLVPLRHVVAVDELSDSEVEEMGLLLKRTSEALRKLTGCSKAYFMFFAEAEGFSHLHVHVVPRMDWFSPEQSGPGVFELLGLPEESALPPGEREQVAHGLHRILAGSA